MLHEVGGLCLVVIWVLTAMDMEPGFPTVLMVAVKEQFLKKVLPVSLIMHDQDFMDRLAKVILIIWSSAFQRKRKRSRGVEQLSHRAYV